MFRRRRKVYVDSLEQDHDFRFFLTFLVLIVVVAGGVYGVGWFLARDQVPRGAQVAGVDVGGRSVAEAEQLVADELDERLSRTVPVRIGPHQVKLSAADLGMSVDAAATVDRTLGGSNSDPLHIWAVLKGGESVDPVIVVDERRLHQQAAALKARFDHPARPYRVVFRSGAPVLEGGRSGLAIDPSNLANAFRRVVDVDRVKQVRLPTTSQPPSVTWAQASHFADGPAKRAVSGPVRLAIAGRTVVVPPDVLARSLTTSPGRRGLRLVGKGAALLRQMPSLSQLGGHPVDAAIVVSKGRPVIRPGRPGVTARPQAWGAALAQAATSKKRAAVVHTTTAQPNLTADDLRKLGLEKVVASTSVRVPSGLRATQVTQLARSLTGATARPGHPIYLVSRLGRGAATREADIVASATFDAGIRAGLKVPTWTATDTATLPVPDGRRVRVGVPGPNLELGTSSKFGAYVRAYVSPGRKRQPAVLHVEVWSTPYWNTQVKAGARTSRLPARTVTRRGRTCKAMPAVDGYRIVLTRTRAHGAERLTDRFVSAYRPRDGVRCVGRKGR